jgi:hypothetical protein
MEGFQGWRRPGVELRGNSGTGLNLPVVSWNDRHGRLLEEVVGEREEQGRREISEFHEWLRAVNPGAGRVGLGTRLQVCDDS